MSADRADFLAHLFSHAAGGIGAGDGPRAFTAFGRARTATPPRKNLAAICLLEQRAASR